MLVYLGKQPQLNYHFIMNINNPTPPIVIDLTGYDYKEDGEVAILTKYVGEDTDILTPGGKSNGVIK